jgi:hypothetical protein
MGKRSSFERIPRDFYVTPYGAVPPLIPHLRGVRTFAEPCSGDGALVRHLESFGLRCGYAGDIATGQDALVLDQYGGAQVIITNPPYTRPVMHALIEHFAGILPTWLLLESDWAHTKQAGPFMPSCSDIVSVGRLRWIAGTTMSSKENFAWYRFDSRHLAGAIFHARPLATTGGNSPMIIHTPQSRRMVGRRFDRLNDRSLRVEEIVADMATGLALHRGLDCFKRVQWVLSDGEIIADDIAREVIKHNDVAGVGDTLFPQFGELSQTFRYVGK